MDRVKLITHDNEQEFRLNRLACQHPLCFSSTYKPKRFVINRGRKGIVLSKGGKDQLGYLFKDDINKRAYSVSMALSDAQQFIDSGVNSLPGDFDHRILMGLISMAIKHKKYYIDFPSTYALLKALGISTGEKEYERMWTSLDKWSKTSLVYQRSIRIYKKEESSLCTKTTTIHGVICVDTSHWDNENEAGIHIEFTERFLEILGIKFSATGLYGEVSKLRGPSSLNLYMYLRGLNGFLDKGKSITRNIEYLCVNKLSVNPSTPLSKMRFILDKAISRLNKASTTGTYNLEFDRKNVSISYRALKTRK